MAMFRGLSAFPLTPTDTSGALRPDALRGMLDAIVAAGCDSIGLLGSTGGYAYLSRDARRSVLRLAVEQVAGRVPIMAGVSALRTDEAVALARDAKAAGTDGLLLAPMSYTPLTEDEVFGHFAAVAQAGGLPLCIYNNPGTTHFTFSEALLARLAALPHIAAVKMPLPTGGDFAVELTRLRSVTPTGFSIGYSGDWGAADALLAGADAWYSVAGGLLPGHALALARAAQAGDAAEVLRRDAGFGPLWSLFRTFGSFRVMFAVAERLGFDSLEPPRPVMPLPNGEQQRVDAALRHLDSSLAGMVV